MSLAVKNHNNIHSYFTYSGVSCYLCSQTLCLSRVNVCDGDECQLVLPSMTAETGGHNDSLLALEAHYRDNSNVYLCYTHIHTILYISLLHRYFKHNIKMLLHPIMSDMISYFFYLLFNYWPNLLNCPFKQI